MSHSAHIWISKHFYCQLRCWFGIWFVVEANKQRHTHMFTKHSRQMLWFHCSHRHSLPIDFSFIVLDTEAIVISLHIYILYESYLLIPTAPHTHTRIHIYIYIYISIRNPLLLYRLSTLFSLGCIAIRFGWMWDVCSFPGNTHEWIECNNNNNYNRANINDKIKIWQSVCAFWDREADKVNNKKARIKFKQIE